MRALLVEDEERLARLMEKAFLSQSFAVDVATSGEEALKLVSHTQYDVIVLDVVLPGIDGKEVCRTMREMKVTVPIIMLSGRSEVDDRIEGLDSGADDYLTKPVSYGELMARIRAVSRRKHAVPQKLISFDGVVVDLDQRIVTRDGQLIDFSPKEFRIFEYFALHRQKVVSRYDILENVWGRGTHLLSNVVDVHMSNLRTKLNRGFSKALIRTVRSGGYILE